MYRIPLNLVTERPTLKQVTLERRPRKGQETAKACPTMRPPHTGSPGSSGMGSGGVYRCIVSARTFSVLKLGCDVGGESRTCVAGFSAARNLGFAWNNPSRLLAFLNLRVLATCCANGITTGITRHDM